MWLAWQDRELPIPSAGVTGLLCCAWLRSSRSLARVAGTFPSLPSAAPQECVDWIGLVTHPKASSGRWWSEE